MTNYRTKNQTVSAKVETTAGVDAVPTMLDAILCEDPQASYELETQDTNESTGSLDDRGPVVGGGRRGFTCAAYLKGSGLAGTAPEAGRLYRGCAMRESLLAAELTGTGTAATASSITVVSATGVKVGMVIEVDTQQRVITAVNGLVLSVYPDFSPTPTAKVYKVYANAHYQPASTALETLSIYRHRHHSTGGLSKLDKVLGAAGTWELALSVRQAGRTTFNFSGLLTDPTDVAAPGSATYDATRPVAFVAADLVLSGVAVKANALSVNYGGTVTLSDDPSQAYGYGPAGVTARQVSGRINPPAALKSVRDALAAWKANQTSPIWARYGSATGNRLSIYIPAALYTGVEDEDVNGYQHEGLPFRAVGNDQGVYLSFA